MNFFAKTFLLSNIWLIQQNCFTPSPLPTEKTTDDFANPQKVEIKGYDDNAMEPFISRDGQYLFFNNSNEPAEKTNLYYARKLDKNAFQYLGEVKGANSETLDAVASMDKENRFYFVSLRHYEKTYSSIFRGDFKNGEISNTTVVSGDFIRGERGWINMDAEIDGEGKFLYYVEAKFTGGNVPVSADLGVANFDNGGFKKVKNTSAIFKNINTNDLEYAPSISADSLELFFSRFVKLARKLILMRATRSNSSEPFAEPEVITAAQGFVEAPSISSDGKTLYFHKMEDGKFSIYKVARIEK